MSDVLTLKRNVSSLAISVLFGYLIFFLFSPGDLQYINICFNK